jgi:hypothetical protein
VGVDRSETELGGGESEEGGLVCKTARGFFRFVFGGAPFVKCAR